MTGEKKKKKAFLPLPIREHMERSNRRAVAKLKRGREGERERGVP